MSEKTRGLVLRTTDYSETSLIVTVFTESRGLLRAIAKGAKRPGSRLYGGLGKFGLSDVLLYPKKSGLHVLAEADPTEGFPQIGESLDAYFAASAAAEILLGMTAEDDPAPEVYALAVATFRDLAGGADPRIVLLRFAARMLTFTGHRPETAACTECGRDLPRRGTALFVPEAGGAVCGRCRDRAPTGGLNVRAGTLSLLGRFLDPSEGVDLLRARIPAASRSEMGKVLARVLGSIMERELRSLRYLEGNGETK
jgi:DNA repair protein RecO (recombination protein O)